MGPFALGDNFYVYRKRFSLIAMIMVHSDFVNQIPLPRTKYPVLFANIW